MAYASAGTIAMPTILSSCSKGANDHVLVAHIGVSSRGTSTTRNYFLSVTDCRSVATCDVWTDRREDLAEQIMVQFFMVPTAG